ncbi:hypothetical protein P3T27_008122 [Kitasatospora sp. MAA19]|uniref:hypothetical protein n=1 Tax=Kitasatospora sp. MAA19 TaxID=3035090 RepID=UPI002476B6E7|nr:hypothetical protein [Kitasatospora sp. MAA19]MDH6711364.1 hypothetical protein [Kitasatospora sp. MAA19]
MTDTTRPDPDPAAAPGRLELASCSSRPVPAGRDLGRPVLDSPLVRGSVWLRWSGHDGIRTLHRGAGLACGWTERDVDGLDGWVALVDGRIVLGAGPDGRPQPVVHDEAWQAGATLHTALAQHPADPQDQDHDHDDDQADEAGPDDQEHGLLGDIRRRVRRRAAGTSLRAITQSLAVIQDHVRTADRYADTGDEKAALPAATARDEWQRIHDHVAATAAPLYDPDQDSELQRALQAEHHRRDIADRHAEAAYQAHRTADAAHRRLAGTAARPLYTALDRAGLHTLTDDDHQAVRDLTHHLDPATLRQVTSWLERTRTAALALRGTEQTPGRPRGRRSRF